MPLARRDPGTTHRAFEAQDRARALGLRLTYRRPTDDWLLTEQDAAPAFQSPWLSEIERELGRRETEQQQ